MKSKRKRKRRKRLLLPNSTLLIIRNSLNIKTNLKKTKNNSISCRRRIRTSLLKNKKETKEDIRIKDFKINRKKELITISKNFQIWINFKINCNMKMKIFYFLVLTIFCKWGKIRRQRRKLNYDPDIYINSQIPYWKIE